jgi:hypothetical protein
MTEAEEAKDPDLKDLLPYGFAIHHGTVSSFLFTHIVSHPSNCITSNRITSHHITSHRFRFLS